MIILLWLIGIGFGCAILGSMCNSGKPVHYVYGGDAKDFISGRETLTGMLKAIQALNMEVYPNPYKTAEEQELAINNIVRILQQILQVTGEKAK